MPIVFDNTNARTRPPFRAEHAGSLLRPESIKTARRQIKNGEITPETLRALEDESIRALVAKQKECGLQAVTDGEYRRAWWHYDFFAGLNGIEKVPAEKSSAFFGEAEKVVLTGNIDFSGHAQLRDFAFLRSVAGETAAKMCIPSPAVLHTVLAVRDEAFSLPQYYANENAFWESIASAYKKAVHAFYAEGCRYLQLDDVTWGPLCSQKERANMQKRGIDPDSLCRRYVELINDVADARPDDMALTMHVCRGFYRSDSMGFEPVAAELFAKVRLDGLLVDYFVEDGADFSPLRHIRNQQVVLGLVSSTSGEPVSKESVKKRVAEASQYVPVNQLCISPQCGFSSNERGNNLTAEEMWDKIRFLVETASEIWG